MWLDSEQEKDNELPLQKTQDLSNPSIGSGGGTNSAPGTGASSNGNPVNAGAAQGPSKPQGFATVQDYLKTNQPQSEDLGQKFTSSLSDTLGKEKGAIDTAAQQTQNDINSGVVNYNADITNQALKDPTQIANNPDQMSAFEKQYNAAYSGPTSFESSTNYTPAITAANEATTKGQELGTEGGREQLLQDQFNVYGQGNKGLDQSLLQSSSAFPTVQNQAKQFGSIQDYLGTQAGNVDTAATNAQATTDATKAQTQGAFANNLTNFQNDLNTRTQTAQDATAATAKTYTDALQSGDATKVSAALQNSNLTDAQKANLVDYLTAINKSYGSTPDLSNFYTANPATDITTANVATPEDYAKAAAYKTLTGTDYSGVLNPNNAAQAGNIPNVNNGINADAAGQSLQQYLMQKESEKFNPQSTGSTLAPGPSGPTKQDKLTTIGGLVAPMTTGTIVGGVKLGQKLSDSLGFGAKHKDAVVNLPGLNLPALSAPANANAATTQLLTDVYDAPIKDAGSYHEGALNDMSARLDSLKAAADKGQLTPEQYATYAKPLAQWVNSAYNTIMGAGSTAAKSVKGGYPAFSSKYADLLK